MSKIKVIQQQEIKDCGHACLLMVLSHFDYFLDLISYKNQYPILDEGSSFLELMQRAEEFHLEATPFSVEINHLDDVVVPAILQIQGNHFVVIEKITKHIVYIIDPALGRRKIYKKDLTEYVNNECYILEFEKKSSFIANNKYITLTIFDIMKNIGNLTSFYVLSFLFTLIIQIVVVLSPFYVQVVFDDVLISYDNNLLTLLCVGFVFIYTFDLLARYLKETLTVHLKLTLTKLLTSKLYAKMMYLKEDFFHTRQSGSILEKFHALEKVITTISAITTVVFIDLFMIVILSIVMFLFSPTLASIVFGVAMIYILLRYLNYKIQIYLYTDELFRLGQENATFLESIQNIKIIKLYGLEFLTKKKFESKLTKRAIA